MNEAIQRLYERRRFGMKPGLQVEQALLSSLGHPERSFSCIHIAGTNGKGSVCAMLHAVLSAAGATVGLYTSPHLVKFNERFVVNGVQIDDAELLPLVERIEEAAEDVAGAAGQDPTFFECATAIAFEYFRQQKVQIAVVETGMGGRLDATNVVTPLVSVVTRIGLEHTAYLGNSLESIAAEKAGIIKPGVPVVAGAMDEESLAVIRRRASEQKSMLIESGKTVSVRMKSTGIEGQRVHAETGGAVYGTISLPLLGMHQVENLATALAVIDLLRDAIGLEIGEEVVRQGIESVRWPGRLQVLSREPLLLVDGAHNPDSARVLAATLRKLVAGRNLGLILGMCGDKDVHGFLRCFSGMIGRLWIVGVKNERNMPAETIMDACREFGMECECAPLETAVVMAQNWAAERDGSVCVTGSLFLVGEMLERGMRAVAGE